MKIPILTCLITLTACISSNESDKYFIIEKNDIGRYVVYNTYLDGENKNEIILISEKHQDCKANKEILEGKFYTFEIEKLTYIEIEDGIKVSLSRGQSIDGVKISGEGKYPYLIKNSCNGYLYD